jgi:hypothetical protein
MVTAMEHPPLRASKKRWRSGRDDKPRKDTGQGQETGSFEAQGRQDTGSSRTEGTQKQMQQGLG